MRAVLGVAAAAAALQWPAARTPLGQCGDLAFSTPLAVGTWQAGNKLLYDYSSERDDELLAAWDLAAERGVRYFDTGDSYGTGDIEGNAELLLGRFAKRNQDALVHAKLATYPWRLRAEDFVAACDASLARLGAEQVALVGQHWSAETYGLGGIQDPAVYAGLASCYKSGRARGVGLSNLGPRGLRRAVAAVNAEGAPVATAQTQFSLLCRAPLEDGFFEAADELGVQSVGYSPLCLGLLSGRYTAAFAASLKGRKAVDGPALPRGVRGFLFRTQLPRLAPLLDALEALSEAKRATVGQVALAWCLRARGPGKPPPLVLVGARTPAMVRDALGAVNVDLSPGDVAELLEIARRCPRAQANSFQTR
mmetsp:Transcript_5616/g.16581  ORF Transcript_5616/g.16581 Transcript_5616/m.16581 type:complete len:365 (+) Transcript_5616:189-1283(+)